MTEDEMVGWHHQLNGHELSKLWVHISSPFSPLLFLMPCPSSLQILCNFSDQRKLFQKLSVPTFINSTLTSLSSIHFKLVSCPMAHPRSGQYLARTNDSLSCPLTSQRSSCKICITSSFKIPVLSCVSVYLNNLCFFWWLLLCKTSIC